MDRKNFYNKGNNAFVCAYCGIHVLPLTNGGYRNHCPKCLYSQHVDVVPGDRRSFCGGLMRPIGLDHNAKKGWLIIQQCLNCNYIGRNKAALDDVQADNYELICELSATQS